MSKEYSNVENTLASAKKALRRSDIQEAMRLSIVLSNRLCWSLGQKDNCQPSEMDTVALDGLRLNGDLWIDYSEFLTDLSHCLGVESNPTSF